MIFINIVWKINFLNKDTIALVTSIRALWPQLGLAEATNLMVYLVGCYSNATQFDQGHINGPLFTIKRYRAGEVIAGYIKRIGTIKAWNLYDQSNQK